MLRKSLQPGFSTEVHEINWKRGVVAVTICAWLPLLVLGAQTWLDFQAAEDNAYDHIVDASHQIEWAVRRYLAENRMLSQAILDEAATGRRVGTDSACPLMCIDALLEIRRRYLDVFPGVELLILDPQGHVIVATEPDIQNRLQGLAELAAHFRSNPNVLAATSYAKNSRSEPALRFSRSRRDPQGELLSVVVIVQPAAPFNELVAVPKLGPERSVALTADGILLARDVPSALVQVGDDVAGSLDRVPDRQPGRGIGSFRSRSAYDGIERLWIRRVIQAAWASGEMRIVVGKGRNDYLAGWYRSTILNAFVGLCLLIGWVWGIGVLRHTARTRARILATVDLLNKVMKSTPLPVAVVSQAEAQVVMSNGAMLNLFGALASVGQPVRQLFKEDQAFGPLHDNQLTLIEAELVSRKGMIQAELHRTDLGDLGGTYGNCWLMVIVDISERHKRERHLQLEATTDSLTGLSNRRQFMIIAEQKMARAREHGTPLSVLALDLDHFKRINDEHGHDVGDLVLTTLSRVFKGVLRDSDEAARVGGEEFAALLPRADREQAAMVAERIRRAVASTPILLPDSQVLMLTVSIGVSPWQTDEPDIQAALKRADVALYAAKEKGRNRVETSQADDADQAGHHEIPQKMLG